MKVFVVIFFSAIAAVSSDENCYTGITKFCKPESQPVEDCSAFFGQAETYLTKLNHYAGLHIQRSFQYLLMSSFLGNYENSREGFQHLYRKLSDEAWEDAIDIMKYITMRGGKVEMKKLEAQVSKSQVPLRDVQSKELESLAKAVVIQKELALKAHSIYKEVNPEDPEMGSYVEDKFMHKQAKTVRMLVGLTNDLKHLLDGNNASTSSGLQNYIIDQYIKKYM